MKIEIGTSIVVLDENNISQFHYPIKPGNVTSLTAFLDKDSKTDIYSEGEISVRTPNKLTVNSEEISIESIRPRRWFDDWLTALIKSPNTPFVMVCLIVCLIACLMIGLVFYDVKIREPYVCQNGQLHKRIEGGILENKNAKCVYEEN